MVLSALLGMLGLTACGGAEVRSEVMTTMSHQFTGFEKTLNAGAMTPASYERERRKVPDKK